MDSPSVDPALRAELLARRHATEGLADDLRRFEARVERLGAVDWRSPAADRFRSVLDAVRVELGTARGTFHRSAAELSEALLR